MNTHYYCASIFLEKVTSNTCTVRKIHCALPGTKHLYRILCLNCLENTLALHGRWRWGALNGILSHNKQSLWSFFAFVPCCPQQLFLEAWVPPYKNFVTLPDLSLTNCPKEQIRIKLCWRMAPRLSYSFPPFMIMHRVLHAIMIWRLHDPRSSMAGAKGPLLQGHSPSSLPFLLKNRMFVKVQCKGWEETEMHKGNKIQFSWQTI